ncbi:MAG: Crp/Fnr family transcriptional regulator [Chloroflexi bacterium]|nr:Crp/Fnr family transcriptional regulator [Chloroflexota bacterium]
MLTAELLARSPLLRNLSPESLSRLASVARRRTYRRGEVVFHQGDPGDSLHILLEGRVKIVLDAESGDEAVIAIFGPGDCFGELALIDGEPRSASVAALEPVHTVSISRNDFMSFVRENPSVAEQLLMTLAGMVRHANEGLADLVFLDMEGRLVKKLLELAASHGRSVDGAIEIELPMTQEDLAAMIGATRASVNKLLGWYEDQGAIQRRGRRIAIFDPERLRRRIN